jgi:hypothetical protein
MIGKQAAQQVLDAMNDDATLDELMRALYIRAKVERADRNIAKGRVTPQEQVKQRFGPCRP